MRGGPPLLKRANPVKGLNGRRRELQLRRRHGGLSAHVRVDAILGAADLAELINRLMACRQAMAPRRWPVMFAGVRIRLGGGVHRQESDDGTLIAVHHPGIGLGGGTRSEFVQR